MPVRVLLTVLSLSLLGFAPAPFPKAERARQDSLDVNGTWEFVHCETSGRVDPFGPLEYLLEMTRDCCVFAVKGGGRDRYEMRLDPTATPPSFTWGQNGGGAYVGSYRLHKDEMTMIFNVGSRVQDRPTDFAGVAAYKYVLRRIRRN
jgi:uncharacterized protein (TIGR03067 family)